MFYNGALQNNDDCLCLWLCLPMQDLQHHIIIIIIIWVDITYFPALFRGTPTEKTELSFFISYGCWCWCCCCFVFHMRFIPHLMGFASWALSVCDRYPGSWYFRPMLSLEFRVADGDVRWYLGAQPRRHYNICFYFFSVFHYFITRRNNLQYGRMRRI